MTVKHEQQVYLHEPMETGNSSIIDDVHNGLTEKQKKLPAKYFYDRKGSELFDAITNLPEYYITRTEINLLKQNMREIAGLLGKHSFLLELGSGSSIKIRLLLEALRPRIYIPMDISREHLIAASRRLAKDYPWLEIQAACIDYSRDWDIPDRGPGRYNVFFPGSSIGNFDRHDVLKLLGKIHKLVGNGGGLLIGVDLKKDINVLEAAYNDGQGVTAEFNLNMLEHINHSLDADFDQHKFRHLAFYNSSRGRVEMHLECTNDHVVKINGNVYSFKTGETIHTENSYKYSIDEFHELVKRENFEPARVWTDKEKLFSLHYLIAR